MLMLEMIMALLIVHFISCLTTKIEISRGIGGLMYCRMLMLEIIIVLLIVHFNSCLTIKIEVSKQRHRWVIDNIWFPNTHLCPVGP